MTYRNKTYVCFDGDRDINYYRLMCAWKKHEGISFDFYNAHNLNTARDNSQEESIKKQLRIRLNNSKVLVVLIGEQTRYLYRFVKWEMEQAIQMKMPIIAVNLNGQRQQDVDRCPPVIRNELIIHVSFNAAILQYALENWPDNHQRYYMEGRSGAFYYKPEIYQQLGL